MDYHNMELDLVKSISECGALGISLVLIIYIYKKDVMFNKTLNNHLSHETESRDKLTIALTKLCEKIDSLK